MIVVDQLNRRVRLEKTPQRIVSLVPSQTELLYALNLKNKIAGITKFCIHPSDALKEKTVVGGTKKINIDTVEQLNPDLIIANKEENTKEDILALENKFPVWISDIRSLEDAYTMIQQVGEITDTAEQAKLLVHAIKKEFATTQHIHSLKVLYLIWRKPYMLAGKNTFIDAILSAGGFTNIIPENKSNYPVLSANEISRLSPDVLFLSSEPFPFKTEHISEFQKIVPDTVIKLVDGELFSWYGNRLLKTPAYLNELIKSLQH